MASAELAKRAIDLAGTIALCSKQKAMKEKGRHFSLRAIHQWLKSDFRNELQTVLAEAYSTAQLLVPEDNPNERLKFVVESLTEKRTRAERHAGRPKHQIGLINSPKSFVVGEKKRGRRPRYARRELERLVRFIEGVRWRSYGQKLSLDDFADIYRHAISVPKSDLKNELKMAVPDAEAIHLFLSRYDQSLTNLPRDPNKLKGVLQNARRTIECKPLPPKVGGIFR